MTQSPSLSEQSEFESALRELIARVEAWSYADSDAGASPAEEIAAELTRLAALSPTQAVKRAMREAQDALDDGLPAESLVAALYRVLTEVQRATSQASRPPLPSE